MANTLDSMKRMGPSGMVGDGRVRIAVQKIEGEFEQGGYQGPLLGQSGLSQAIMDGNNPFHSSQMIVHRSGSPTPYMQPVFAVPNAVGVPNPAMAVGANPAATPTVMALPAPAGVPGGPPSAPPPRSLSNDPAQPITPEAVTV